MNLSFLARIYRSDKVSGSHHGKACMEEHTAVSVFLVEFEFIDLAIFIPGRSEIWTIA